MKTIFHLALFNIEDLMILIVDLDSSMRKLLEVRMVMKIMTCACETVTDEKVQMIVRCAETDASQCLVHF